MSDYDFTYEVPSNFEQRIIQFLQQLGQNCIFRLNSAPFPEIQST